MPALKYSRQREAIKSFLMTRKDHPTADVVYHSPCRLSKHQSWNCLPEPDAAC